MPDPRDLSLFRGMTITDVDETAYRLVGTYLKSQEALLDTSDGYEVCLICAMDSSDVREMKGEVRALKTHDKSAIHQKMTEYMLADEHAQLPAPGLHLVGLMSKDRYMQQRHPWKHPAVLSRKIDRVE